ncbi:ROK family transcriptional regulator [Hazenella sp. IB182353]|uniref:ROK family transcriptional regulator n=1 Tax=Polycladospora coralii TaxID=2771432 RepID=UPI001746A93A|nr:ROK family transcriptional regulator [Polycladospora coralii]MBS7530335.1 ROK family transcriptional regulator [Polycladospora coralii]
MKTGSFQWMKSLNKSTILNMIRLHGPISRAEIAKITKLTPPTVTNIVNELLDDHLVVESDLGTSTGGRKPIMLEVNNRHFSVIGIYIRERGIDVAVANLDGTINHKLELEISEHPTKEEFLKELTNAVSLALEKSKADEKPTLGVGIGIQGQVNPLKGEAKWVPNLKLENIPIKTHLESRFHIPIEVDHDVRAIALAENWFGQGRDLNNFICVKVGTRIGAGIMLNQELYYGAHYSAGEIEHTPIDLDGPACSCGKRGCLAAFVGAPGIVRRAKQALADGESSILHQSVQKQSGADLTSKDVYTAAMEGDVLAIRLLGEAGQYLGMEITNLIHVLDPDCVILHGGVSRAEPLQEAVHAYLLAHVSSQVSIVQTKLGKVAPVMGAFTLALKKIFDPHIDEIDHSTLRKGEQW